MPSTSCSINGPSLHSSRTVGSRHSIETGDRYLFHTNSSISKISVEPSGGMRIACTEHGDEVLLILLHNPCLFLNRCKGTKNIIDKQIILSIFASAISIIKEANDPSTIEIVSEYLISRQKINTATETLQGLTRPSIPLPCDSLVRQFSCRRWSAGGRWCRYRVCQRVGRSNSGDRRSDS